MAGEYQVTVVKYEMPPLAMDIVEEARISQMTSPALACDLRQVLENRGLDDLRAKVTGEPNG